MKQIKVICLYYGLLSNKFLKGIYKILEHNVFNEKVEVLFDFFNFKE